MPESSSHIALKQLLATKFKAWYGSAVDEYPSSGHELDVFATTTTGVSVYVEIIWSKTQFLSDINMLQQSTADVKLAVASREVLANIQMVREFGKVVISQREQGKKIHGDLLDGQRMMQDSEFVDHDFRNLIDQLISQSRKEKENAVNSAASNAQRRYITPLKKPANRLVPIRSFRLPPELRKVYADTVAFMVFRDDSEMFIEIYYDSHPAREVGLLIAGHALGIDRFLSILKLNPEIGDYEFGLTGRPNSILIVLFEGEETLGYIGSYKLLESLRGLHGDELRKTIRLWSSI
ncbi:MAG: hypothetical protein WB661_02930 [Candidatus Bathyarchaeia archaeon]